MTSECDVLRKGSARFQTRAARILLFLQKEARGASPLQRLASDKTKRLGILLESARFEPRASLSRSAQFFLSALKQAGVQLAAAARSESHSSWSFRTTL